MRSQLIAIGLIALTVVAYEGVRQCDFVSFDDNVYVTDNPHVLNGLSLAGLHYAFTTFDGGNWHPLTWLSLQFDASLIGPNAATFHLLNVGWHIANVLLLFVVLQELTARPWLSAFIAALFAVHPLHVQSVAWISERKDVLSTFWLLVAVWAYIRFARQPSHLLMTLVGGAMCAGLMSKPMLVTLPLLLLLLDVWPLNRLALPGNQAGPSTTPVRRLLIEKLPLFVLTLIWCVITPLAQESIRAVNGLSFGVRVANACQATLWYVGKTFVPISLAVYYPHQREAVSIGWSVAAALVIVAMIAIAWRERHRRPYLIVGWLWFLIALIPVIGLIQVGGQATADRYTYVPHIGLFVALVWGLTDVGIRWRFPREGLAILATLLLVACVLLTRQQVETWRNTRTLWEHALAVTGENWMARFHLGSLDYSTGRLVEAAEHFRRGLERNPHDANAHLYLGGILADQGQYADAERQLAEAVRLNPRQLTAFQGLAIAQLRQGHVAEAEGTLIALLKQAPDNIAAHQYLAAMFEDQQRRAEALDHYRKILRLQPLDPAAQAAVERLTKP